MTDTQLTSPNVEFANFLTGLGRLLDPATGWYGVFAHRDPEGLRACLEGRELPPRDVVESLLHDLAARHGDQAVRAMGPRARRLHARAVADHDAQPGGRPALRERLELMRRAQRRAARRADELQAAARAAADPPERERLSRELAWARDDLVRAEARVRELRARLAALTDAPVPPVSGAAVAPVPTVGDATGAPGPAPESPVRAARPRGARFAGLELPDGPPAAEPVPVGPPSPPPAAAPALRGARFAGACTTPHETAGGAPDRGPDAPPPAPEPEARHTATATVRRLAQLRASGASGPAHAELCAATTRPAPELPLLLAALEEAQLASDVPVLLWEVAGLPPARLAAAADALAAAGRTADAAALLRQSVARPVAEVAATARALLDLARPGQARELLAAVARSRTPDEAAALAVADPETLGPLLLAAARAVSPDRHRDLAHALRAAGYPAVP
ncbi:hypothetical protein ACO0M4_07345 [Streptomyces sp. RGM 3693]|uniref:hypothetical protein n=1 Tax=Streptomyces sp. RGM 3693 TaxID=3413284 RepID=UPI003D27291F